MIYKLEHQPGYVIAARHCWLPGVYETERACRYAFRFDNVTLERLASQKDGQLITWDDLALARRSGRAGLEVA